MGRKKVDPIWSHGTCVSENSRMHVMCNYCKGKFWGGVIRMEYHLACTHVEVSVCPKVPYDVKQFFIDYIVQVEKK